MSSVPAAASNTPERKGRKPPRKPQTATTPSTSESTTSNVVENDDGDVELMQSIASKASIALLHPQVTLTCYIPTPSVGAVIGRRGSTILQIQKQAQQTPYATGGPVRVSIVGHEEKPEATSAEGDGGNNNNTPTASAASASGGTAAATSSSNPSASSSSPSVPYTYSELDWSCPHWTPVVIRADPIAAVAAATLLEKLVEDVDEVVLDLPISRMRHAAIVGKRGMVLANLSADTQVRIMVPRKDLRHDVVQLEGDLQRVTVCLERILVLASESNNNKKKGVGSPGRDENKTEASSADLLQETLVVSNLPPQTKLRQIGRKTDTTIKRKKNDDEWILTVLGKEQEHIQSAISMITKFIESLNSNEHASPSRPNNNNRRSRKPPGRKKTSGGRGGGPPPGGNNNDNAGSAAPVEQNSS